MQKTVVPGSPGCLQPGDEAQKVDDVTATTNVVSLREWLTFFHNGRDERLTDVAGHVVEQILT